MEFRSPGAAFVWAEPRFRPSNDHGLFNLCVLAPILDGNNPLHTGEFYIAQVSFNIFTHSFSYDKLELCGGRRPLWNDVQKDLACVHVWEGTVYYQQRKLVTTSHDIQEGEDRPRGRGST